MQKQRNQEALEHLYQVLKQVQACSWVNNCLVLLDDSYEETLRLEREELDAIEPDLAFVCAEILKLHQAGLATDLHRTLLSTIDYWRPTTRVYVENTPLGKLNYPIEKVQELYVLPTTPADRVHAKMSVYDTYTTREEVVFCYSLAVRAHHLEIAWFDKFSPGAAARIRHGLALGLTGEELAEVALYSPCSSHTIDLPLDINNDLAP